jgi:hypothetical protein
MNHEHETRMIHQVKIERTYNSEEWKYLCTVDLDSESTWPASLPGDIRDLLHDAREDLAIVDNQKHGADGCHYRLTGL